MPANAGDMGSILGSGRSPREGNDNPLKYSCLGNSMVRGAWQAPEGCRVRHDWAHMHAWFGEYIFFNLEFWEGMYQEHFQIFYILCLL